MQKEAISVFDIFKIGVGPSSSHTLGPWRAAERFLKEINLADVVSIEVKLYGSLAKTGKGHGTDIAVILGLNGEDPVTFDTTILTQTIDAIKTERKIKLAGKAEIVFDAEVDIVFLKKESLPFHPNALKFIATFKDGSVKEETYYSIGGGFVAKEGESSSKAQSVSLKYDVHDADELLQNCMRAGLSVSQLVMENEKIWRSEDDTRQGILNLKNVMFDCIYRGCYSEERTLPGGLNVARRAAKMNKLLLKNIPYHSFDEWIAAIKNTDRSFTNTMNWISCFALAVNEENASFGRVVTAPTNGAAGVIPAVLLYYHLFASGTEDENIIQFILTAA
jgi:L-serine dehydratase